METDSSGILTVIHPNGYDYFDLKSSNDSIHIEFDVSVSVGDVLKADGSIFTGYYYWVDSGSSAGGGLSVDLAVEAAP